MATLLSSYRTDVRTILHDTNSNFYTDTEVNNAINEGRRKVVADTGCLRQLQTVYLNTNVESYTFGTITGVSVSAVGTGYTSAPTVSFSGGGGSGAAATATVASGAVTAITVTNVGTGYTSAPTVSFSGGGGSGAAAVTGVITTSTLDILNVSAIWGNTRYVLDWRAWSEFNASVRYWTNWQQRPAVWSLYGEQILYIGPLPDQIYQAEVDSIVIPNTLVDDTTVEQINLAYQGPIKYYAAYILKLKEQSFGESEHFHKLYADRVQQVINEVFTRRIPSMYEG